MHSASSAAANAAIELYGMNAKPPFALDLLPGYVVISLMC